MFLEKMFKGLSSFLKAKKKILIILSVVILPLLFFWKFFLKGLIPIPADIIVGMYYPFRNYIWDGFVAGVPIKNGIISDPVSQIYPWRLLASEQWQAGQVPLWNPYILGGIPLAANIQSAVFYPFNFIFFLNANGFTWGITIVLQSALAFYFMYLFLREIKLDNLVAIFGALAFTFNGFFLFWLEWGSLVAVCCWLPLLLWAIEKISKNKKGWLKYWFIFILGTAMSILAGHFQMAFYVGLAAFIYGLIRGKKIALLVIVGGLLALLLTSFQILPAFEAYKLSIRDAEGMLKVKNYGFLRVTNLITFLAPDFFGNPGTGNWWGFSRGIKLTPYVGIVTFFFFIFSIPLLSFKNKGNKSLLYSWIILIIAVLLLFSNPISSLIYKNSKINIPGVSSSPANRAVFLLNLAIILGAVKGLNLFLSKKLKKQTFLTIGLLGFILLLLWETVVFSLKMRLPFIDDLNFWHVAAHNLILPTLLWAAISILSFVYLFFPIPKKAVLFLLVFFLGFELFREGWKLNSFSKRNWIFPNIPETEFLQEKAGIDRVEGAILPNMKMPYHLYGVSGYELLINKRLASFISACNSQKKQSIYYPVSRYAGLYPQSHCADLFGVKYLLTIDIPWMDESTGKFLKSEKYIEIKNFGVGNKSVIFENQKVIPRAFLVDNFRTVSSKEEMAALLIEDRGIQFNREIVLDKEIENLPNSNASFIGRVGFLSYTPQRVSLTTESNKMGLLFISDNYYPGWEVFVDGKEKEIYRANYTFRAVSVPQGKHKVEFIYRPQSFKMGMLIAEITALLLAGFLIIFNKISKKI